MSSDSSGSKSGLVLVVIAIAIGIGMFFFLRGNGDNPNGDGNDPIADNGDPDSENTNDSAPTLSADEYAGCYEFANIGLGHLENLKFRDAETTFKALRTKLPNELLPLQNLALTQTMMVVEDSSELVKERTKGGADAYASAVEVARETLDALSSKQPALAKMLGGLITVKEGKTEAGIDELREAAELEKTNAAYWFALYKAHANLTLKPGEPPPSLAIQAIEQAYQLEPENLHAIAELLTTQAQAKSEKLVETLTAAKEVVKPLAASIKSRTRIDLPEMFDKAIKDLNDGGRRGWVYARQIANLLKPDIAKRIDQRNLDRNLLEYVVVEYGSDFDKLATDAGYKVAVDEPIDVKFVEAQNGLPELSGVTDVKIADMNLDALPDIVVVREGNIEVYARKVENGAPTGDWTLVGSFIAPEGLSIQHIKLADLDRDYEDSSASQKYRVVHDGEGVPRFDEKQGYVFTDTDPDIVAFGTSGVTLVRNAPKRNPFAREFTVIPIEDDAFAALSDVADVATVDVDHDGDLDLAIGKPDGVSVWINQSTKKDVRFANGDENVGSIPMAKRFAN